MNRLLSWRLLRRDGSAAKKYKVCCPDDLCSGFELQGIMSYGEDNADCAFVITALDMNISVIHYLAEKQNTEYTCREEAMWQSILLLAELRRGVDIPTVDKLYAELDRTWQAYNALDSTMARASEKAPDKTLE